MGWQILSLPIMSETFNGLANSDLLIMSKSFIKVCLPAFAESEFGNPFYKGKSPIMGWQIPICQKERSSLKKSMPYGICRIGIRQPILQR